MTKDRWLERAKSLHQTAASKQRQSNGGKKCTTTEAGELNELQHAIGSHHGVHTVTYTQMREALDEMFEWVKGGKKDELFA